MIINMQWAITHFSPAAIERKELEAWLDTSWQVCPECGHMAQLEGDAICFECQIAEPESWTDTPEFTDTVSREEMLWERFDCWWSDR